MRKFNRLWSLGIISFDFCIFFLASRAKMIYEDDSNYYSSQNLKFCFVLVRYNWWSNYFSVH